ncbi:hypothetical protein K5X82_15010 [Halosquirtibacter xylanolyticus]|uniref:amylo-alpha-1,6-glucosidase n=1 Tax=Halosquirtibacter xylanolyticus TaxID=3374599 RepID=UPI00374A8184|nr:hypothetical protein K5X82_15010 [Prolixibacteraceae bacterium]
MKLKLYIVFMLVLPMIISSCDSSSDDRYSSRDSVDRLGVDIGVNEQRMVAYSNKMDSYYQTTTHGVESELYGWFDGWNIGQRRILKGYQLYVDGILFDRAGAKVKVYPHYLERRGDQGAEELYLFDDQQFIEVDLCDVVGDYVRMSLVHGDGLLEFIDVDERGVIFRSKESGGYVYLTSDAEDISLKDGSIDVKVGSGRCVHFYLIYSKDRSLLMDQAAVAASMSHKLKRERADRMNRLIQESTYTQTNDTLVNRALKWFTLTMDGLVTHQRGYGIYAGVPWFNEYWGRDTFISLPGGTLVLGDTSTAKQILDSFASVQDTVEDSKYYGRIPNIVKMSSLNYHTTDGTPRFISQMMAYVQYSGDTASIATFYPTVRRSIEGAMKRWTNDRGYLIHADNETWMDARRASDLKSYSPRDEAANDIQSLWMDQLLTGIKFATYLDRTEDARKWQAMYDKVKTHFIRDYWSDKRGYLADRIDPRGVADYQLRPNQLFALKHVDDIKKKKKVVRLVWERLVYPWGVSSLDHDDPDFHPFHLAWSHYHKDEAYHNGTVWQWLNGVAMQEMIEIGGKDIAYKLFHNMCRQGMERTGVGMVNENSDCYPHKGGDYPRLTGTYWQAWSEAEQIRVWYQYFMGVRPSDNALDAITFAPRIPTALTDVDVEVPIMGGHIRYSFLRGTGLMDKYLIHSDGVVTKLILDFPSFSKRVIEVADGDVIEVGIGEDLYYELRNVVGEVIKRETLDMDEHRRRKYLEGYHEVQNVLFAQPNWNIIYPVLEKAYQGGQGF